MRWSCWSFSWASTAEWTGIWKQLHKTKMSIYNRERIQFSAFISTMPSFMAVLFNYFTSLLGEDLTDYDSSFSRLTISIDNKERLKFSTFISNMRCSYVFIGKEWRIILHDSVNLSLFLRAKLHKLHIRHLFNTSNLCINGCYVK